MGLQKILQLLESDDANIRIHAVKVVANLAAEGNYLICIISKVQLFFLLWVLIVFPTYIFGFDKQRQIKKRLLKLEA